MTKKLLLALFLFTSVCTFAQQDKKWSVEANYPISIGDDLGNDTPGIIDLGIKYRFLDLSFAKIGIGFNAGVFTNEVRSFDNVAGETESFNIDETNWIFSPKFFSEFKILGAERLRPSIGLGYSIVSSKFEGQSFGVPISSSDSNGGLNLNIGLSYDITKRIFVQAQYDYIRNIFEVQAFPGTNEVKQNLGFLKLGLGFRF